MEKIQKWWLGLNLQKLKLLIKKKKAKMKTNNAEAQKVIFDGGILYTPKISKYPFVIGIDQSHVLVVPTSNN